MQTHNNNNQYLEQWSCHKTQRLVLAWWPMSGEHATKRDPNKSVFFWRKKILEPVSLPFQITIIYQGKRHKRKRRRNRNSWRKEKNNSSVVHNTSRTNTKRVGIPCKMCYHWLLILRMTYWKEENKRTELESSRV